jgi:predicted dehydrogenase
MADLRAGVIGTGFMGAVTVEAIRRSGMGDVIAIAGSSEQAAQKKASELNISRAYGNYVDLINDPDVQVVHTCTPNNLHFPINRAVLAAGKPAFSEKPLAMDAREARLLMSAAERKSIVSAVMFNYRHYPAVERLRKMVSAGKLGTIYAVHGNYLADEYLYETDYDWRIDPERGGVARVVFDIGSHWFDLAQYITGLTITQVIADLQTFLPVRKKSVTTIGTFGHSIEPRLVDVRVDTEDYASVLLRFQDGARGSLTLSQVSAGKKNHLFLQIDGSLMSAAWNQEEAETLCLGYRDRPNEVKKEKMTKSKSDNFAHYPAGHGEAYANGIRDCVREVYKYIAAGKKPGRDPATFATFRDGYRSSVLIDKVFFSGHQGRWVKTHLKGQSA